MNQAPPSPATGRALLLASTLTVMAGATISPALPDIAAHFGDDERTAFLVRLVLTLPALFIVLAAPFAGWACDRIGRRPVLLTGLLLYVVAGASGLFAQSLEGLLLGRAGLGIGVAAIITATTAIMIDLYRGSAQTRMLGLQGAFMAGGGVVFVLFGGLSAEWHWRAPFAIYAVALLLWPALRALPEPMRGREPAPAVAPGRWLPLYLIGVLGMMCFYFVPVHLPFLLHERMGTGSAVTGMAVALGNVAAAAAGLMFPWLRTRLPPMAVVALMALGMAAGYAIIGASATAAAFALGLVIAGLGIGLLVPNLNHWVASRADDAVRGRAIGGLATAFFLGQFLSPLAAQPLVAGVGLGGLYSLSAAVLLPAALAAGVWAWRSSRSKASLRHR